MVGIGFEMFKVFCSMGVMVVVGVCDEVWVKVFVCEFMFKTTFIVRVFRFDLSCLKLVYVFVDVFFVFNFKFIVFVNNVGIMFCLFDVDLYWDFVFYVKFFNYFVLT